MKHCSVVPHIIGRGFQVDFRDVGNKPVDTLRGFPKTLLVRVDGRLRNIEDGDAFVSAGKKIINQCGLTAADVNDRSRSTRSRLLYQSERGFKVRAVPADCVRSFLCVDLFPMGLCIHTD